MKHQSSSRFCTSYKNSYSAVLSACGLQTARSVAVQASQGVHRSASNYERRGRPETVRRAKMSQPEPLLKPNPSALALDIDGTITTASPAVVHELVRAARVLGSKVAVNTARPASYCRDPYLTKFLNIPLEDNYC